MSELVPCPGCRRHVATHERACPFCNRVLPPLRAQRVALVGRVSRAAVFSAALAACSGDKQPPAPAAPPAQGSDDLEQLLDQDGHEIAHPDVPPPSDAAAEPIADAAVDAGVPDAAVVKKKKKRKQQVRDVKQELDRVRIHNAKPYGAPPARRRIV